MFKKLIALLLMVNISNIYPIILRDGYNIRKEVLDEKWTALKFLQTQKKIFISYLYFACQDNNNLSNIPIKTNNDWDVRQIFKDQEDKASAIKFLHQLNLCDELGVIDQDTVHIIKSAIKIVPKASYIPCLIDFHSPAAWENYKYPKYWIGKDI